MARILLIEDMNGVRQSILAILKRGNHTVTEAVNGKDGLLKLQSQPFDVVITDMIMPETDGTEVIMQTRAMPNRPKILAISGGGWQVNSNEALTLARSQADAALAKPFSREELEETLERLLG